MGAQKELVSFGSLSFKYTTEKLKQMCPVWKLHFFLLIIQRKGNSLFIHLCLSKYKLAKTYSQKTMHFLHFKRQKTCNWTSYFFPWGDKFWWYFFFLVFRNGKIYGEVAWTGPWDSNQALGGVWGQRGQNFCSDPEDKSVRWLLVFFELGHPEGTGLINFETSSFDVTIGDLSIVFKQVNKNQLYFVKVLKIVNSHFSSF